METFYYILILLFGLATYVSGVAQMLSGAYSPSFFSRGVWFLVGVNSFFGVLLGNGSKSSVALAGAFLVGNAATFITSYKKGSREFGLTEKLSLLLLGVSAVAWLVVGSPLTSLWIGLVAHFIGALPTFKRAIQKPQSEQAWHWYFFFIASVLTIISTSQRSVSTILFPVYFVLFDGAIILLVNRNKLLGASKSRA